LIVVIAEIRLFGETVPTDYTIIINKLRKKNPKEMSTKSKEFAELPFTRLSYEVVILSLELSSVPKDSLFSLELSKGKFAIS